MGSEQPCMGEPKQRVASRRVAKGTYKHREMVLSKNRASRANEVNRLLRVNTYRYSCEHIFVWAYGKRRIVRERRTSKRGVATMNFSSSRTMSAGSTRTTLASQSRHVAVLRVRAQASTASPAKPVWTGGWVLARFPPPPPLSYFRNHYRYRPSGPASALHPARVTLPISSTSSSVVEGLVEEGHSVHTWHCTPARAPLAPSCMRGSPAPPDGSSAGLSFLHLHTCMRGRQWHSASSQPPPPHTPALTQATASPRVLPTGPSARPGCSPS